MKIDVTIQGTLMRDKKAGGQYRVFQTSDGDMSCFEKDAEDKLMNCMGEYVTIEIQERNGFKNITKYVGYAAPVERVEPTTQTIDSKVVPVVKDTVSDEPTFRFNIKQTAKGHHYYEATVRADTIEALADRLRQVTRLGDEACSALNVAVEPKEVA